MSYGSPLTPEPRVSDDDHSTEPPDIDSADALPPWALAAVERLRPDSESGGRLVLWLPVLGAAWGAGRRAVALGGALRTSLTAEEPLAWPDELASELVVGLQELAEVLPSLEEAIPALSELVDLGTDYVDPDVARAILVDSLSQAERWGEKAVRSLLDLAFFASDGDDLARRTRHLHRLFTRLEALFDRALEIWLTEKS